MSLDTHTLDPALLPKALPLSCSARRRYGLLRWLTLGAPTLVVLINLDPHALLPGIPIWAGLLGAYLWLVWYQYRNRGQEDALGLDPQWYLVLSALLLFGLIVAPSAATNGQSFWYCAMYFALVGESSRHLATTRALAAMVALCTALLLCGLLLISSPGDWLRVSLPFLPFLAGLIASASGGRIQRIQEIEHAARLALLKELAQSKAELEEANGQLQAYAGTVEQLAVANERDRLARELHDILGYTLATVVVKAEAAKRLLASDLERALGELDRVQEVARSGLAEVRQSVRGLRDVTTAPGIWHEVIARFVDEFAREHGIAVDQCIDPLPPGHAPELEFCLFRVIQEALTNVARHAQARHVTVVLRASGTQVELRIEDDGVGIGPGEPAGGFGLRGMRERVALLGGNLLFSSQRGAGVRILVTLPVAPASSCPTGDKSVPSTGENLRTQAVSAWASGKATR
jgi:signal transduction histidine kinase